MICGLVLQGVVTLEMYLKVYIFLIVEMAGSEEKISYVN